MARRNSLDHSGFMRHRGPAGAVAENVAVGCETEECARRMWMHSPRHRANMMLGGCHAVASAVSASGRRYWVMEIGGGRGGGTSRDFSVEGGNAPYRGAPAPFSGILRLTIKILCRRVIGTA